MKKNRVDIITLGCSKNLVDSERLMHMFGSIGYQVFHDSEKISGEIVVINTCGFIGDAKEESIETILRMAKAKKAGAIGKLYVMGCLTERYRSEIAEEIPELDGIYGKFDWKELVSSIDKAYSSDFSDFRILSTPNHYAYVKISEGCNRSCSYCAIPLITGRYKSRPISEIIDEVSLLCENGVKEIQLIAQDLTYYGKDLYKRYALSSLLEELVKIKELKWIRLHYAYPTHFPLDILPLIANEDKICNYLDIALQHSSNHMLSLMRRNITKEKTEDLLEQIREEVPNIHLRTTMMVGHPGETEEDFLDLISFVKKQRFERLGAFAYSHEDDTYSWKNYEDSIPFEVKQERLSELMRVQESIAAEIASNKIGKTFSVIIDRKEGDNFIGRTEYDSPDVDPEVILPINDTIEVGNFYGVIITDSLGQDLVGKIID